MNGDKETAEAMDTIVGKIASLNNEIKCKDELIKKLTKRNDDLFNENLRWEEVCDKQQKRIEDLDKKNDNLRNVICEKEKDIADLKYKVEGAVKTGADIYRIQTDKIIELNKKIEKMEFEKSEILRKLRYAERERDELEKKMNESIVVEDQLINTLRTNSECKDKHVKNLLERIKELETANESMDQLKKEDYMDILKREAIENVKDEDPEVIRNWMVRIVEELFYGRPQRMSDCHDYKYSADHGYKYKPCRRCYSKHFDCHCQSVKRKKRSEKESE